MKKSITRSIVSLLTVTLILAFIPKSSLAEGEETAYPLWVGETQVTSSNSSGEGWSYEGNSTQGTLKLTGIQLYSHSVQGENGYRYGIYAGYGLSLTIQLEGNNAVADGTMDTAIYSDGDIRICGTGAFLQTMANVTAIEARSLEITGVRLQCSTFNEGTVMKAAEMNIKNANISSVGSYAETGIHCTGDMSIEESVIFSGGEHTGIYVGGKLDISGDSNVAAHADEDSSTDMAIFAGTIDMHDLIITEPKRSHICEEGEGKSIYDEIFEELAKYVVIELPPIPLYVNGAQITRKYKANAEEGWSYEGDENGGTLKLTNATITNPYYNIAKARYEGCIQNENIGSSFALVIELEGTNTVGNDQSLYGIAYIWDLTIKGEGKLIVAGGNTGILGSKLIIENGADVEAGANDIAVSTGTLEIKDSSVSAQANGAGINVGSKLSISGKSHVLASVSGTGESDHALWFSELELSGVEISNPVNFHTESFHSHQTICPEGSNEAAKTVVFDYIYVPVYSVQEENGGTYVLGSNATHTITIKRDEDDQTCFDHFNNSEDGVTLDGIKLVRDVDYSAQSGSTVITLQAQTLEKLRAGEHAIVVNFDDGKAETKLTVKAKNVPNIPDTADRGY